MKPPPDIVDLEGRLRDWLLRHAFPIWWDPGADHARGGFHDRLDSGGCALIGPKRARVAARQVYAYAVAREMAWDGPWRAAMDHGLAFLENAHRRPDGLYRANVDPSDEAVDLYDQAFVLLAGSCAARNGDVDAAARARELFARLPAEASGGFACFDNGALEANPNMHLFEAFLAWMDADPAGPWRDAAAGQARLALTRLIDHESGALGEVFTAAWASPERTARRVEPGHQFEWAWLLMRWSLASGDAAALAAALRLIEIGERAGVDGRGVAINALDGALAVTDGATRLWPQTERLRVHLLAGVLTGAEGCWSAALETATGLQWFLDVPTSGLWRDSLESADLSAPASSLYHIVGAIRQLGAAVRGEP